MKVEVIGDKFEKYFRVFKKKVDDAGILKDLRDREFYCKPSLARKLKRNAAKKRWQKHLELNRLPERKY
jgi:small subunit ribosomal protein S21